MRPIDLTELSWADERGWGVRPVEGLPLEWEELEEMHVVSLRPGAVRGNHVHDEGTEWLLICGGPAVAAWRAPGQESVGRMEVPGDTPVLLEFPAGTEHAVRNDGAAVIHLMGFTDREDRSTRQVDPLL